MTFYRSILLKTSLLKLASCLGFVAIVATSGQHPAQALELTTGKAGSFTLTDSRGLSSSSTAVKAVRAANKKHYNDAQSLARSSGNPVAQNTVEWLFLKYKPKEAGYTRIIRFIQRHPNWPQTSYLLKLAEERLLYGNASTTLIINHFNSFKPKSRAGYIAQARGLMAQGQRQQAANAIRHAWYDIDLTSGEKKIILREFKGLLSASDHKTRLWKLIHGQQTNAAIRTAQLISKSHVAAAKAAQALIRRHKNGVRLYKKLPSSLRNTAALRYALARYYRRTKKYSSARSMLLKGPTKFSDKVTANAWWVERRLLVRHSIGKHSRKHYSAAYKLATMHGGTRGKEFEEGEFLAGWVALRKLKRAKTALKHFKRLSAAATTRTEKSRGDYWTGRAYQALGNRTQATRSYQLAAASPTLYYGQLAREAIGLARRRINVASPTPSTALHNKISRNELVQAIELLAAANAESQAGRFIWPLASTFRTRAEASAVARVLYKEAGAYYTIRFAKAASRFNADIDDWGYPISSMPKYRIIGKKVEPAVIYGLIRQESEFHAKAGSHAGAHGLMQIMPGTAKGLARRYGYKHSVSKLTSNPSYNVTLGVAFLGELLTRFNGSYIMTFAGYNAGPRRPVEWMAEYGDPRTGEIDPIDWVESIPFTETRTYVQKVLQNIHVYRSRLKPASMIGMSVDLHRGGRSAPRVSPTNDCSGKAGSLSNLIINCN